MTTFAFVAGMAPLITSNGIGSGMSKAMAQVVVGGQTLSLLLTLVAIPVIYTWFDDLARLWRKYGSWIGFFIGLGLGLGGGLVGPGIGHRHRAGIVRRTGPRLRDRHPLSRACATRKRERDRGASELGIVDIYSANK